MKAKLCWALSKNFWKQKVCWHHPAVIALLPQVNFPTNNLNFHWRWRWWDLIQAIFLNLFYFINMKESLWTHLKIYFVNCKISKYLYDFLKVVSRSNWDITWTLPCVTNLKKSKELFLRTLGVLRSNVDTLGRNGSYIFRAPYGHPWKKLWPI